MNLTDKEKVDLKNLLSKLCPAHARFEFGYSCEVPGIEYNIILLPKKSNSYSSSSKPTQRRRRARLRSLVQMCNMTKIEGALALCTKKELRTFLVSSKLSVSQANALIMTRRFTSRDIEFLRNYLADIPSVKDLRQAHWDHIKSLPALNILHADSSQWTTMSQGRVSMTSNIGRNISAVRYSIPEFLSSRISELLELYGFVSGLGLKTIPFQNRSTTVPVLFSIDSGTGTVKLMAKFLLDDCSQKTDEIFLLAEACGSDERFSALERYFGKCASEIQMLAENGIQIGPTHYNIVPIWVADFKVYYAMTGNLGPNSSYPCPWCAVNRNNMDAMRSKLFQSHKCDSSAGLPFRPPVADLSNSLADFGKLQKKNTYNLFKLVTRPRMNFVPPPLHIKLGLVNKLIEVLDSLNTHWAKVNYWTKMEFEKNPIEQQLRYALSTVKVKRQKYYSGQIDGVGCVQLMENMAIFCENFFDTELVDGTLGYYLSTSKEWDQLDIDAFDNITERFLAEIKRSLWRPPRVETPEEPWRRPWIMPKLHSLIVHVKEVVEIYGFFGVFSEEGMEHMQQISKRVRNLHSPNKSLGAQIVDDLQYTAVLSSPRTKKLRRIAENICVENGRPLKKLRYQ